jgi:hypothetical protein
MGLPLNFLSITKQSSHGDCCLGRGVDPFLIHLILELDLARI